MEDGAHLCELVAVVFDFRSVHCETLLKLLQGVHAQLPMMVMVVVLAVETNSKVASSSTFAVSWPAVEMHPM